MDTTRFRLWVEDCQEDDHVVPAAAGDFRLLVDKCQEGDHAVPAQEKTQELFCFQELSGTDEFLPDCHCSGECGSSQGDL